MVKNKPSQIFGWSMFDFANTSFTVIVVTVIFPVYFKETICTITSFELLGFTFKNPADLFWGIGSSLAYFIVALSAPILGAMSDFTSRKKKYIFYYSLLCILATFGIYYLEPGDILIAIGLYVLGNVGFETGIIFYDAFLPVIATEDKYSKFSGYGYAAGYLGAMISLMIAFLYFGTESFKDIFIVGALFFLVSSLPFFLIVKEKKRERIATFTQAINHSVKQVKNTVKNIQNYPAILRFILSYFLFINGVGTIIAFGGLYASGTLGFTLEEIIIFFGLVQLFAMIGSFAFGFLGQKIGEYKALSLTLFLWMIVCLGAFSSSFVLFKKELFYSVGILAGLSLGSCQSLSRSYFSRMLPKDREAEFFGFYAVCGRFAAIIGPFLFGIVSSMTGRQEFAVLSILIFFISGLLLLRKVPVLIKLQ